MTTRLLLQKRPGFGPLAWAGHILTVIVLSIRYLKWCPWSHAEIEINGICYSATTDRGARAARAPLEDGSYDAVDAPGVDITDALLRFTPMEGNGYDWLGAIWWGLPFANQRTGRHSCFEVVATMLGMPEPHKQGPFELIAWVEKLSLEHSAEGAVNT